jgi:hypothetical protein
MASGQEHAGKISYLVHVFDYRAEHGFWKMGSSQGHASPLEQVVDFFGSSRKFSFLNRY